MKTTNKLLITATAIFLWSCGGQNSNDPAAKADSVNEAVTDSAQSAGIPMAAPAEDDAKFAVDAANGGMAEVQLGQLAQSKATDPKVKEFGQMMVTDHSKANEELKTLAASKNITLPAAPSEANQKTEADLTSKSAADFDKAYIKQMVKDHEATVKLFEDGQKNVKDADIKAFIDKTLPVLRTHLEQSKSLDKAK
ncbi:DUF4142 domain-containing protein [Niabella beijingensis]|uniref:DUF4142 domain-containing protein n=1 Tax=Niabella beijingensis TaxID=2872700 RepID=UPI001CBF6638|nr:DUF4142 domain-containing protein [Niabella beijingensis]MBZ4192579.1 DUF4142 domain-containing protein [Niabella beijingensis]